jgi:hypothetical protein
MNISDELIACYVEGTVTAEERNFVRKYLCNHPEEYERVLCLIDNDVVDYLGKQSEISDNCISMNETSFANIAYSAAAFAPEQNNLFIPKQKSKLSKTNGLYDRLSKMSNELDDIL